MKRWRLLVAVTLFATFVLGMAFSQTTKPWDQMTLQEKLARTIETNERLRAQRDALQAEQARLDAVAHDREVELQAQLAQVTEANLGLSGHVAELEGQVQRLTLILTEPAWWVRDADPPGWYSLIVETEPMFYENAQQWVTAGVKMKRVYYELWPLEGLPVLEPKGKVAVEVLVRTTP